MEVEEEFHVFIVSNIDLFSRTISLIFSLVGEE